MSEKDEWKKLNKGEDCEITQPDTPELCYPRNVYSNNRYTEKLLQYRKLKDNNNIIKFCVALLFILPSISEMLGKNWESCFHFL